MKQDVRALVGEIANLAVPLTELDDESNLFEAGMSSLEVVTLVVALERKYGFRFDQNAMCIDAFRSIASISDAVAKARGHA
jgi:acyl carrier protein